ncbi:MAG: hypothetical protein IID15_09120 [Candidatus Marinimicrobia bacterium]|nr:hypothetical protein [Candidatus Neomarinimicrobiota bacterium]
MKRSILAVLGGYLVMYIAILVPFFIWFREPSAALTLGFMLFSLAFGFMAATAGGYVAAAIARRKEMAHVAALASFATLLGVYIMTRLADMAPLWYQVTLIVTMIPAVLLGGFVRAGRRAGANRQVEADAAD